MKKEEKIAYLKEHHESAWIASRKKIEDVLSDSQPLLCMCGALATGLHEMHCRRFNARVDSETLKELKNLFRKTKTETSGV